MNQFMSNLVCEGFSSCSTGIEYGHKNAEMQKRKFDDFTLQYSIYFSECPRTKIHCLGYGAQNKYFPGVLSRNIKYCPPSKIVFIYLELPV